jgi:hypothetical protein
VSDWLLSTIWYLAFVLLLAGVVATVRPIRLAAVGTRARALGLVLASGCAIALVGWVPPAAQTGTTTTRLDEFVPRYHFREVHTRSVMADAPTVMRAVKSVSADEIALFDLFTRIRRLGRPAPASILNPPRGAPILSVATQTGFLLLADDEHEIVLGTLLAHPGPRPDRADIDAAWFAALSAPGVIKAVMNFRVQRAGIRHSILSTETRVFGADDDSARRFTAYWRTIFPGSWILRATWLRAIDERAAREPIR